MTTQTENLKASGYICRRETISGQGYFGGDGIDCFRVRDAAGNLAIYAISTYRTAWQAWAEAAHIASKAA